MVVSRGAPLAVVLSTICELLAAMVAEDCEAAKHRCGRFVVKQDRALDEQVRSVRLNWAQPP